MINKKDIKMSSGKVGDYTQVIKKKPKPNREKRPDFIIPDEKRTRIKRKGE